MHLYQRLDDLQLFEQEHINYYYIDFFSYFEVIFCLYLKLSFSSINLLQHLIYLVVSLQELRLQEDLHLAKNSSMRSFHFKIFNYSNDLKNFALFLYYNYHQQYSVLKINFHLLFNFTSSLSFLHLSFQNFILKHRESYYFMNHLFAENFLLVISTIILFYRPLRHLKIP